MWVVDLGRLGRGGGDGMEFVGGAFPDTGDFGGVFRPDVFF